MAAPLAHVVFLFDGSGSMGGRRREATIKAFEAFVSTLQKTKGAEIKLTAIEYKESSRVVYRAKPIQDVESPGWYRPNASEDTLFDAVAFAVEVAKKEEAKRPCKTVIVVLCDGGDNWSMNTADSTRAIVERQLAAGWEFCFLAAGNCAIVARRDLRACDSFSGGPAGVARRIGIPDASILQYDVDDSGAGIKAFGASAWGVGSFVSGRAAHVKVKG